MARIEQMLACSIVVSRAGLFICPSCIWVRADAMPAPHSGGGGEPQKDIPSQTAKRWTGNNATGKWKMRRSPEPVFLEICAASGC